MGALILIGGTQMLKNIPDCISPELLKALAEMGHGDEIVFGDGNFPAHSNCSRVIRADGHSVTELIDAVLKLMPLDTMMEDYAFVMATADGSTPPIWTDYQAVIGRYGYEPKLKQVERFAFYRQTREAFCVVATSERALCANLILKKGVC